MRKARVLKPPTIFGEEMVGHSCTRHRMGVISLSHVMTLSISKVDFDDILADYPTMRPILRKTQLRDIMREKVRARSTAGCTLHLQIMAGCVLTGCTLHSVTHLFCYVLLACLAICNTMSVRPPGTVECVAGHVHIGD